MISDGAGTVARAIGEAVAAALGETAVVTVYDHEPDTAAAPCVWITFLEARYAAGSWVVSFEASLVADAGLGALDAQRQLAAMTDAVLTMDCPGVVTLDMVARGGGLTARIGDVPHPVHLVTIPQLNQVC